MADPAGFTESALRWLATAAFALYLHAVYAFRAHKWAGAQVAFLRKVSRRDTDSVALVWALFIDFWVVLVLFLPYDDDNPQLFYSLLISWLRGTSPTLSQAPVAPHHSLLGWWVLPLTIALYLHLLWVYRATFSWATRQVAALRRVLHLPSDHAVLAAAIFFHLVTIVTFVLRARVRGR
jgi:hypothetical protein